MSYAVGSLIQARNREWVVLPGSDDRLLLVRPLGGQTTSRPVCCSTLSR